MERGGAATVRCPKGYGYYECEEHQEAKNRWDQQAPAAALTTI